MTNELVTTNGKDLITFDEDKVGLIKRTIAPTATDDELALFLHQCQRTGLDPLARQIYFQKYNTKSGPKMAIITGIDGYRLVADRTGKYAGSDEPVYEGKVNGYPAKASITVWKIVGGQRVPFSASVYWAEYYPGDGNIGTMWRKMPHVMLGKVAEAAALRKAFPADLSGVYTRDEMEQAWSELPTPPRYDEVYDEAMETMEAEESLRPIPVSSRDTTLIIHGDSRGAASPQAQAEREALRPAANGNGNLVADLRASLESNGRPTWATLASAVVAACPHYQANAHVYNAAAGYPKLPDGYSIVHNKQIKQESAVLIFDWLLNRVEEAQE